MDNSKKAAFVRAHKIQKFARGGTVKPLPRKYFATGAQVLGGPTTAGTPNAVNPATSGVAGISNSIGNNSIVSNPILNPGNLLGGYAGPATGIINGIASAMTDNFQATGAPVQAGTNADQLNAAYQGVQGALGTQTGI